MKLQLRLQANNTQAKNLEYVLKLESDKCKHLWIQKCKQLLAHEYELVEKDLEFVRLHSQLKALTCGGKRQGGRESTRPERARENGHDHCPSRTSILQSNTQSLAHLNSITRKQHGKAPPH